MNTSPQVRNLMIKCAQLLSHIQLFSIPWSVAHQVLQSMGFPRQEYWSGLLFPSPGDRPNTGIQPTSPALQEDSLPLSHQGSPIIKYPASKRHSRNVCRCSEWSKGIPSLVKGWQGLNCSQRMLYNKIPKNLQIHISLSATSDINFHRRQKKKRQDSSIAIHTLHDGGYGAFSPEWEHALPSRWAIRALVIIRLSCSVSSAKKEERQGEE